MESTDGFLPWLDAEAAKESRNGLLEFASITPDEQDYWRRYVLSGPSEFRRTVMIAEIRNLMIDFLTQSRTLTPVDEEWIDGMMGHPDEVWERRIESVKAARRKERLASARALREREMRAERGE